MTNPCEHISVIIYEDGHRHEEEYRDFGYGLKLEEATTPTDLGPIKNILSYTSLKMATKVKTMFKMQCRLTVGINDINKRM